MNQNTPKQETPEQTAKRIELEDKILQSISLQGDTVNVEAVEDSEDETVIKAVLTKNRKSEVIKAFHLDKLEASEAITMLIDSLLSGIESETNRDYIYLRGSTLQEYIDLNGQFNGNYRSQPFIKNRLNKSKLFSGLTFGISGERNKDYKSLQDIIFTVTTETVAHRVQRIVNTNTVNSQINHAYKPKSDTFGELLELSENGDKVQKRQAKLCINADFESEMSEVKNAEVSATA